MPTSLAAIGSRTPNANFNLPRRPFPAADCACHRAAHAFVVRVFAREVQRFFDRRRKGFHGVASAHADVAVGTFREWVGLPVVDSE